MATTILDGVYDGTVCTNACFRLGPGDQSPDYLALFGPAFGDLMGDSFHLVVGGGGTSYSLTINNHTLSWANPSPHYSVTVADPALGYGASFVFTGIANNIYGIAQAETEYLCDPVMPGVPEPATWALMLLGFGLVAGFARLRRSIVARHSPAN